MKDIILKTGTHTVAVTNKDVASGRIPGTSLEKFVVNLLKNPSCCAKFVVLTKGTVTQGTSVTTAVTLNQPAGELVTFSLAAIAADTTATFTVNNSYVKADSLILANVVDWTGSTGFPLIIVDDVVAGSFKISIRNVSASAALDGVLTVGFAIM
jgi:hypothetical protein